MKLFNLLAYYLYLTKKNVTATENKTIKTLHLINRVSLFVFLLGLLIMISNLITKGFLPH